MGGNPPIRGEWTHVYKSHLKRRELARKKQDVISPGEKTNGSGENE